MENSFQWFNRGPGGSGRRAKNAINTSNPSSSSSNYATTSHGGEPPQRSPPPSPSMNQHLYFHNFHAQDVTYHHNSTSLPTSPRSPYQQSFPQSHPYHHQEQHHYQSPRELCELGAATTMNNTFTQTEQYLPPYYPDKYSSETFESPKSFPFPLHTKRSTTSQNVPLVPLMSAPANDRDEKLTNFGIQDHQTTCTPQSEPIQIPFSNKQLFDSGSWELTSEEIERRRQNCLRKMSISALVNDSDSIVGSKAHTI